MTYKFPGLIGFDEFFNHSHTSYPPYNLIKDGDSYCLQLAVAGFNKDEVSVVLTEKNLVVRGEKREKKSVEYLHKGIGTRSFRREFTLAKDVEVSDASLVDGILHVHLRHVEPKSASIKHIPIS